MKTKLEKAVKILIKNLKKDKRYRESWKANIAVQFQDAVYLHRQTSHKEYLNKKDIHKISNEAADNFLNLLCKQ